MKKYTCHPVWIVFVISAVFQACSDYSDYNNQEPDFTELGSMIIGSDGGTVSFEGIQLNILPGAFDRDEEIRVLVDKSGEHTDNQNLTPLFRIEGFPDQVSKTVTVRLDLNGTVEGTPLAGLGRKGWAVSRQKFDHPLLPVRASVEGNQMVVDLSDGSDSGSGPKLGTLGVNSSNNLHLGFHVVALQSKMQDTTDQGHFVITNDLNQTILIHKLEEYLEAAYDTCINMGFDLSGRKWPLTVSVTSIQDALGQYTASYLDPMETDQDIRDCFNDGFIQFSKEILSDDQDLRATVIHEFFHLVQNLYEFSCPVFEPEQTWLQEALSVWIESKLAGKTDYISSSLAPRDHYLLAGWQKTGTDDDIAEHGYGMAPLIKAIEKNYQNDGIVQILESIKRGVVPQSVTDPVEAITGVVDIPVAQFWHSTISSYLTGAMYGGSLSRSVLNNRENHEATLRIAKEKDFSQTLNLEMKNLSAQLVQVDVDNSQLDNIPSLSFQISDAEHGGLTALKYSDQSVQQIATTSAGSGTLVVFGIKDLFTSGHQLMILISNGNAEKNYEDSNAVTLTMQVPEPGGWELAYQCDFYGLTSFNGADILASLITFQNVAHPVIIDGDGKDFYSEYSFENGVIFLDIMAEGSIGFRVDNEGIHNLQVSMSWQKATGDYRQSEQFTIDFVPLTATDGKLRTYTMTGYNLFADKAYVQSERGTNVLRYEGPDPSTNQSDWMQERILIYLREGH